MNEKPKLGTIDSALVACVSMLSALTGQRTEELAGWLDLYYQTRRWWEISQGNEPDPQLIRKDELRPLLRDAVRDAIRGAAKEEAGKRMAKKAAGGASPSPTGAEEADPIKRRATPFKRQVADRLAEARKNGATIAQIAKASGGTVAEGQILSILEGHALATVVYTALDAALAQIEAGQA